MRPLPRMSAAELDALATKGNLIPVWRELPADTETPVSAYLKLPSPRASFLLESLQGGERWGRYSFLGDEPRALIRQRGGITTVEENGKTAERTDANPTEALRAVLKRHRLARPAGLPPFVGGLVGYAGYGAVRWFEPRVPQRHGGDADFPDGEWMLADRLVCFDNLTQRLRVMACAHVDEHGSTTDAYRRTMERVDALAEALQKPLPPQAAFPGVSGLTEQWSRPEFEAAVRKAQAYIAAGDCMQVVLSRRLEGRYTGEPFALYRALRQVSPTPYLFFLRFGDRALAGASPELLVKLQGGTVTVRPIAGTRPRGKDAADDLRLEADLKADTKERAEHVMLVDLGRNDVGRVAQVGSVRVEEREVIERYSHVMHLVSQVSGKLKPGLDGFDVLGASFPAGTVSGAPKVRAMEIIDELEPHARGPYAGAAGYFGFDGDMDLAISIRSVALAGERLRFQSGAGIVHDSVPASEFDETNHKLRAQRVALGDEGA